MGWDGIEVQTFSFNSKGGSETSKALNALPGLLMLLSS